MKVETAVGAVVAVLIVVPALVIFGLGFLPGTACRGCPDSTADHLGLWGWALTVALPTLAILVLPILEKVFKKAGGTIRHTSPDVSNDDILFALHTLGGTRLVWGAYAVGDGSLEIGSLHLEDRTGKPVPFGWAARPCEDDAYELANRYSAVPGHYVLALPSGTVISAPSKDGADVCR